MENHTAVNIHELHLPVSINQNIRPNTEPQSKAAKDTDSAMPFLKSFKTQKTLYIYEAMHMK